MPRLSTLVRAAVALSAELLAPSVCAACDARVAPRVLFCPACATGLQRSEGGEPCPAAFVYAGPVAKAITRMKYGERADLGPRLGEALAASLVASPVTRHLFEDVDLVVPVPIHPRRLVARGFDQASLVALPVAHTLRVPRALGILERMHDTHAQVGLSRDARRANVANAFRCTRPAVVSGRVILVVDDVVTTGATMAWCTTTLARAGARKVLTAAVAVRVEE